MTEAGPKKDNKDGPKGSSWADTVRDLNERKTNGVIDAITNEAALAGAGIAAAPGNAALAGTAGYFGGKRLAGSLFNFQHPEATGLKSQIQDILNTPRPVGPGVEPARMPTVANPGPVPIAPLNPRGGAYSATSSVPAMQQFRADLAAHPSRLASYNDFLANQAAHQSWKQQSYDHGEALKNLKLNQNKIPTLEKSLERVLATKGTAGQTLNGKPGGWTRAGLGGIPGALLAILGSGPVSNYMSNYYKKED